MVPGVRVAESMLVIKVSYCHSATREVFLRQVVEHSSTPSPLTSHQLQTRTGIGLALESQGQVALDGAHHRGKETAGVSLQELGGSRVVHGGEVEEGGSCGLEVGIGLHEQTQGGWLGGIGIASVAKVFVGDVFAGKEIVAGVLVYANVCGTLLDCGDGCPGDKFEGDGSLQVVESAEQVLVVGEDEFVGLLVRDSGLLIVGTEYLLLQVQDVLDEGLSVGSVLHWILNPEQCLHQFVVVLGSGHPLHQGEVVQDLQAKSRNSVDWVDAGQLGPGLAELQVLHRPRVGSVQLVGQLPQRKRTHQGTVAQQTGHQLDRHQLVLAAEGVAPLITHRLALHFVLDRAVEGQGQLPQSTSLTHQS